MNPALQGLLTIVIGVGGCIGYFFLSNQILDKVIFPPSGPNAGRNINRAGMVRPWLFLIPAIIALGLYLAYPVFATLWLSLTDRDAGGAFVGLEKIMSRTHGFGFIATSGEDNQNILDRLNKRVKPTDLFEFGLIPEFTGRLPIIANFEDLNREMLVRIMSVPKNSIYRQYQEIFKAEGVELSIGPRVFEQISELAIEYKTGARSLRGIFEELMTPILYLVPDHPEICRIEIDSLFEDPRVLRRA